MEVAFLLPTQQPKGSNTGTGEIFSPYCKFSEQYWDRTHLVLCNGLRQFSWRWRAELSTTKRVMIWLFSYTSFTTALVISSSTDRPKLFRWNDRNAGSEDPKLFRNLSNEIFTFVTKKFLQIFAFSISEKKEKNSIWKHFCSSFPFLATKLQCLRRKYYSTIVSITLQSLREVEDLRS